MNAKLSPRMACADRLCTGRQFGLLRKFIIPQTSGSTSNVFSQFTYTIYSRLSLHRIG